ncbi:MAG: hypothetical protein WCF19_00255 [Chlamydiales bacterium]
MSIQFEGYHQSYHKNTIVHLNLTAKTPRSTERLLSIAFVKKKNQECVIRFSQCEEIAKIMTIQGESLPLDRESRQYEIRAERAPLFFGAIKQLQEKGCKIWPNSTDFAKTLLALQKNRYMDQPVPQMRTALTLSDQGKLIQNTKDMRGAIAFAERYLSYGYLSTALFWVCEAKRYADPTKLRTHINLNEITKKYHIIESMTMFNKDEEGEITNAFALSSLLETLDLSSSHNYSQFAVGNISLLLQNTQSIKTVTLSVHNQQQGTLINKTTIPYIINALRFNTSIETLNLPRADINNEHLMELISAIQQNPHSKIEHLDLSGCRFRDTCVEPVIQFIKIKKIKTFNILNSGVNTPNVNQITRACALNKTSAAARKWFFPHR